MLLQFLLAILLNGVFDVESLPAGDGHIRIKRYGRTFFLYCMTQCYISCCDLLALAASTERGVKKQDEKDKSDSEVVHSITINVRRSGSEHSRPTQVTSKSEKSVLSARETQDKVILVPQIRQKLFTCREMSRRTVREAADSKRKFKPMKTALSGRRHSVRAATNTALGHSKLGTKKSNLRSGSVKSTRSGTISGSSKVSTSSSSSSSSGSSSPASESYTVSSSRRSMRSSRSGRSGRSKRSSREGRSKRSSREGRSKRSSRGGRSSRKSSKRSGRSRK
uniref:SRRM_C domain-containing protein n=1 Tax=Meloidogyne hapla TaxID=6305 RepID=A0A1I8B1J3_MELHA